MKYVYIILGLLVLIGLVMGVYVWAKLQDLQSAGEAYRQTQADEQVSETLEPDTDPGAITVTGDQLSPEQKQTLESFGFDTDEITITPEMIACAEAKLGEARIAEITGGASPTPVESFTLLGCIK